MRGPSAVSERPDISVIIVNYNGQRHLDTCLRAVAAQQRPEVECVLVDNTSADDSVAFVREHFPWVQVVRSETNLGFAGGNNLGARSARGRLLAFLNNDTQADAAWLAALQRVCDESDEIGLVTSRIVYMHDPSVLDSAGDGMTRPGGAFKRGHGMPASLYMQREDVFGACGAAFMIRRALFEEVGGFDEDFFVSHEDVDLSYRVRLRGYRCVYVPEALVLHAGSATLGRMSRVAVYYGQRNLEWVLLKNTPTALWPMVVPLHAVYLLAAFGYFASMGRLGTFVAAKLAAARGVPRVLARRAAIQRARRARAFDIWRAMDPGWIAIKLREKRFDAGIGKSS
jgi:GT2 family glycosyltransferase